MKGYSASGWIWHSLDSQCFVCSFFCLGHSISCLSLYGRMLSTVQGRQKAELEPWEKEKSLVSDPTASSPPFFWGTRFHRIFFKTALQILLLQGGGARWELKKPSCGQWAHAEIWYWFMDEKRGFFSVLGILNIFLSLRFSSLKWGCEKQMCSKAESPGTTQPLVATLHLRVDAVHSNKTQLFFYAHHGVISTELKNVASKVSPGTNPFIVERNHERLALRGFLNRNRLKTPPN